MNIWERLSENAHGYDSIIFAAAIVTAIIFLWIWGYSWDFRAYFSTHYVERKENNSKRELIRKRKYASEAKIQSKYAFQTCLYGIFINLISIFPLLGMLGTVTALLNLNFEEMNNELVDNFFSALTSTFWGAVFGMIFKVLDAIPNYYVESNNESYRIGIQRENLDTEENGEKNETQSNIS